MTADTILHLYTPTTLRRQLLTIFRHSYVVLYTDKTQTYNNLTMKFIITVFQFMYLLILPSNAASYNNYTIVFSTDIAGVFKVG